MGNIGPCVPQLSAASSCPPEGLFLLTLPLPRSLTSTHHLLSCLAAGSQVSAVGRGELLLFRPRPLPVAFPVGAAASGPRGQAQAQGGSLSLLLHLRRSLSLLGLRRWGRGLPRRCLPSTCDVPTGMLPDLSTCLFSLSHDVIASGSHFQKYLELGAGQGLCHWCRGSATVLTQRARPLYRLGRRTRLVLSPPSVGPACFRMVGMAVVVGRRDATSQTPPVLWKLKPHGRDDTK